MTPAPRWFYATVAGAVAIAALAVVLHVRWIALSGPAVFDTWSGRLCSASTCWRPRYDQEATNKPDLAAMPAAPVSTLERVKRMADSINAHTP